MSLSLPVLFKTPSKNKEVLLKSFPKYKNDIENLKGEEFNRLIIAIKDYVILRMKQDAIENISVLDFFDNKNKIIQLTSKYVDYHFTNNFDTKYNNIASEEFRSFLFSGFALIKGSFLSENMDNLFLVLKERNFI